MGNADYGNSESLSGTEGDDGSYILKEKYSEENGKYSTTKMFPTEFDEKSPLRKKPTIRKSRKSMLQKVG